MRRHLAAAVPEAEIRGLLVRRMIPAGHELILGAKRDPAFGPTLMFGLGGIYVELFEDVTFGLAPIDRATAARMVRQVKACRLLEGMRGAPAADIENIQECLAAAGTIGGRFPADRRTGHQPADRRTGRGRQRRGRRPHPPGRRRASQLLDRKKTQGESHGQE